MRPSRNGTRTKFRLADSVALQDGFLGTDQGVTGFDPAPFNPQPLYGGNPWFLRVVEQWMRLKDRQAGVAPVRWR